MSRLLSATLGRLMPRYRTFSDWLVIYRQIIDARPLQPKTLANRYRRAGLHATRDTAPRMRKARRDAGLFVVLADSSREGD